MSGLLAGIDVGTASTKGVLVRPDGSTVAEARVNHAMSIPRPGWAEHDAEAVWWADVVEVSRQLVGRVPTGDRVEGVAVSAIGPCLLPIDEAGDPLRPAILYGVDTRATAQIATLERRHGRAALAEWSLMDLSSQAVGPKILWLRENEPDVFEVSRWLVTSTSFLVHRLTGRVVIDAHTASHFNPLFDPRTVAWSERYADSITGIDRLPTVAYPADVAGPLTDQAAARTGLPAGIPVAVGTVDALAEAVSVGVTEPGDLMIMYGSTTFFILVTDRAVAAGPLWMTAGVERGRWALAAGLATSGSAMAWFRDELARDLVAAERSGGANAFEALAREAAAASAEEGPLFLPYLSGERTPINDPLARGVVAGLSLGTTRGSLYRALLEGIAHATRANIDALRALGMDVKRAVAVGGGTANRLLVQLVSDASGVVQELPASTIGASRGDAFIAGLAAGVVKPGDLAAWVRPAGTVEPDRERRTRWDLRAGSLSGLYAATRDVIHMLAAPGR